MEQTGMETEKVGENTFCADCDHSILCWTFMSKKERTRKGQPVVGCTQEKYIYADEVDAGTLKRFEKWAEQTVRCMNESR